MEQWNDTLAKGFASGCAPNMDGREEIPSGTPTKSSTTSLGSFVSMDEPSAFRGPNREPFSESRMREKRLSGSMSGLCQEDEKSSCCTKDEGGPFGAAL